MEYVDVATRVLVANSQGQMVALIDDTETEDSSDAMSWEEDSDMGQEEGSNNDGDVVMGNDNNAEEPPPSVHCPKCSKVYRTNKSLQTHIKDRHQGTVCYYPGCEFITADRTDEGALCKHLLEHHNQSIAKGNDERQCSWGDCAKLFTRSGTAYRCVKGHHLKAVGEMAAQLK